MIHTNKPIKVTFQAFGILLMTAYSPALAQDIEAGEKVFKKCKACHTVGEGAKKKVGPILNNIYGQTAGSGDGFKYSKSMIEEGENGLVWNDETLTAFLKKPKSVVPKTKMSFAGLKKEEDLLNILAYLKTFSANE